MTTIGQRIRQGKLDHGDRFSAEALLQAHPTVQQFYGTVKRVKVRTTYSDGGGFERTGVISTTTGWVPAFLLIHRSNAMGSWDVLGAHDEVVAVWNGRRYVELS